MDYGYQHIGGGRPRMVTDYFTDRTVTSYSCIYTYLVEE